MKIEDRKYVEAEMVDVDGERYLRMQTFPGSNLHSWFQATTTGVCPDFQFKWLGQQSTELEQEFQAQLAIERAQHG